MNQPEHTERHLQQNDRSGDQHQRPSGRRMVRSTHIKVIAEMIIVNLKVEMIVVNHVQLK